MSADAVQINTSFIKDSIAYNNYKDVYLSYIYNDSSLNTKVSSPESTKSLFGISENSKKEISGTKHQIIKNPDWIFLLLIICFALLTGIKFSSKIRLKQIINAFRAYRYMSPLIRDGNLLFERISILLYFNYSISITLFFSRFLKSYSNNILKIDQFYFFFYILLFFLTYSIFKKVCIYLVGIIFSTQEVALNHILINLVFNQVIGVFLAPLVLLLYYLPYSYQDFVLQFTFALLILVYVYKFYRIVHLGLISSKISVLNLFIYLCTAEILPVLLFVKFVFDYQ